MPHTPFHTTRSTGPGARTKRELELGRRYRKPARPPLKVEDPSDIGLVSRATGRQTVMRPRLGRGGGAPAPVAGPLRGDPTPTPDPLQGSYGEGGGGPGSAGYERFLEDYPDFKDSEAHEAAMNAQAALDQGREARKTGVWRDILSFMGEWSRRSRILNLPSPLPGDLLASSSPDQVRRQIEFKETNKIEELYQDSWYATDKVIATTDYGPMTVQATGRIPNPFDKLWNGMGFIDKESESRIRKSLEEMEAKKEGVPETSVETMTDEEREDYLQTLRAMGEFGGGPINVPSDMLPEQDIIDALAELDLTGTFPSAEDRIFGDYEERADVTEEEPEVAEGEGGPAPVLETPWGDVGVIPESSYVKDPNETDWENEADMAFIYREIIGLATKAELAAWGIGFDDSFDETQRKDPYNPTGVPFGDAFERYGYIGKDGQEHTWSMDDAAGNAPGEIEWNLPPLGAEGAWGNVIYTKPAILEHAENYLRSIAYTDEDLRLQRAAGWAFYNYSADELRAAGRGGGGAPVGAGGAGGEGGAGGAGGGGRAFNDGGEADEYPWARDLRGHVARDFDASWNLVGGNAPAAWQPYLPQEINPDSIFVAVSNAILPFLSQSDRRKMGRRLQLLVGDDGGLDGYDALPRFTYGTENWEELIWNPDKWGDLVTTLYNLRTSLQGIAGPEARLLDSLFVELDWMIGAAKFIDDEYSGGPMTAWEIQDWTSTVTDLFQDAEGTGDPQNPGLATGYGPLLKMLVEPYVPYLDSIFTGGVKEGLAAYGA